MASKKKGVAAFFMVRATVTLEEEKSGEQRPRAFRRSRGNSRAGVPKRGKFLRVSWESELAEGVAPMLRGKGNMRFRSTRQDQLVGKRFE